MTTVASSTRTSRIFLTPAEQERRHRQEEAARRAKKKPPRPSVGARIRVTDREEPERSEPSLVDAALTSTISELDTTIPPAIAADQRRRKIWDDADEDARFLGQALCELGCQLGAVGIESYFQFAELWHQRYPKNDKKNYTRGMNSVKVGASMSPYSASQVYTILRTIHLYSWSEYADLAAKATTGGVIILWTHLRTIAARLSKSEFRAVRRQVEKKLVSEQMTESRLNRLIDELAPDTVKNKDRLHTDKPTKARISGLVASLGKTTRQCKSWHEMIVKFENEFQGDDPEEVSATKEQITLVLNLFDEMTAFVNENRSILETLQTEVAFLAEKGGTIDSEKKRQLAAKIESEIKTQRHEKEEQVRRRDERILLAGSFSDEPVERKKKKPQNMIDSRPLAREEGDENEYAALRFGEDEDAWGDDAWDGIDPNDDELAEMDEMAFTDDGDLV